MRRKTYKELENEILELSRSEAGIRGLKVRRDVILGLSDSSLMRLSNLTVGEGQIRRRPNIYLLTNQGGARSKNLKLSVEMRGQGIGTLVVPESGSAEFRAVQSKEGWAWSGNRGDADRIRTYFQGAEAALAPMELQEREIQACMFNVIRRKGGGTPFENLAPVLLAGYPSEIPTWINRMALVGTGNIDALVRGKLGPGDPPFFVFELKRPELNKNKPQVVEALQQAVTYAIALSIEANGFRPVETEDGLKWEESYETRDLRKKYRRYFGAGAKDSPLRIGAVAVVPDTEANRIEVKTALEQLQGNPNSLVNRLGVLAYKKAISKAEEWEWEWLFRGDPPISGA